MKISTHIRACVHTHIHTAANTQVRQSYSFFFLIKIYYRFLFVIRFHEENRIDAIVMFGIGLVANTRFGLNGNFT